MPEQKPTHTPGPWLILRDAPRGRARCLIIDDNYYEIAAMNTARPNHEQDARLIAAAPGMLEALQKIAREYPDTGASEVAIRALCKINY